MPSDRGLFTPEMAQAERELDARIDHAMSVMSRVRAKVDEFEQKVGEPERPTDDQVERIKNFVVGHAKTAEWQLVIDRINRGQLTWRQVVEGLAYGNLDSEVSAAFRSLSRVPPASMEKLVEIGVFPRELPAEAPAEDEAADEAAEPRAPRRRPRPVRDEEEVFDDPLGWQQPDSWR